MPQLEIGLAYDKNQSMFTLEIGKGANFGTQSQSRAPGEVESSILFVEKSGKARLDTYVQISLCNNNGEEIVANRTGTRQGQHHPVFAERYPFNIQENLLDQVTFHLTVVNKKPSGKTDREFGWIAFGKLN